MSSERAGPQHDPTSAPEHSSETLIVGSSVLESSGLDAAFPRELPSEPPTTGRYPSVRPIAKTDANDPSNQHSRFERNLGDRSSVEMGAALSSLSAWCQTETESFFVSRVVPRGPGMWLCTGLSLPEGTRLHVELQGSETLGDDDKNSINGLVVFARVSGKRPAIYVVPEPSDIGNTDTKTSQVGHAQESWLDEEDDAEGDIGSGLWPMR